MKTNQLLRGPAVVRGVSLPKAMDEALRERSRVEDRPASTIVKRALLLYFQSNGDDQEVGDEQR